MKIAIGIPVQDNVPGECFGYHLATIAEAVKLIGSGGELMTITPVGLSPHDVARDVITTAALEAGCDRLMWIDDDTICPRGGFSTLMKIMDERKCAAVSGYYLRRGNPYTPVWSYEKDGSWYNIVSNGGVHEIHVSGLGCCLVDLNWMKDKVPQPWYRMKQSERSTIITDDVVMFEAIRAAGGLVLGAADVQCPHIGQRQFIVPSISDQLRLMHKTLEDERVIKLVPVQSPIVEEKK